MALQLLAQRLPAPPRLHPAHRLAEGQVVVLVRFLLCVFMFMVLGDGGGRSWWMFVHDPNSPPSHMHIYVWMDGWDHYTHVGVVVGADLVDPQVHRLALLVLS